MSNRNLILAAAGGAPSGPTDPNFNQTVLLLHGDGTNGAQNNTFLDSSTNNFTITRNGNTTQGTFSPFSNADGEWSNYFDGSGDYLTIPDNGDLDLGTGNFSCELWCYLTTDGSDQYFLSGTATGDYNFGFVTSDKTIRFGRINTAWDATSSAVTISNGWHHILATRVSGTLRIFFDGVEIFSGANTQNYIVTTSLIIGSDRGTGRYVNGYLSNVRVVKGAGVTSVTVPTTPLTAISGTELLTCQSNRFVDNSSNAFAITVNGNTSVQPFSPFAPSAAYSASVNGGSGYFDSSGDYLSFANDADFSFSGDFCVEAWYYYQGFTTSDPAIVSISDASNDGFCGFSQARLLLRQDDGTTIWDYAYTELTKNVWTHLAVTRSGTTIRFFINGVQEATTTSSATIASSSGTGYIGSRLSSNGRAYNYGYIGPVRIVNGSAVYTAAFTPPTAPPTAIANTVFLLNFTNAGIFDNTGKNNLETVGNAQIDTTTVKYGTGSMEFDGTGDYLVGPNQPWLNFGSGDFTIECWLQLNSTATAMMIATTNYNSTTGAGGWAFIYRGDISSLSLSVNANVTYTKAWSPSTGTWYHVAVSRSGTDLRLFVDGTQIGTTSTSSDNITGATTLVVAGNLGGGTNLVLNGFIDDLRITKGVARYTTTFTPPTAAFPDL